MRGLNWGTSAISNATWTGVKLADVLAAAGAKEEQVEHVHFQGETQRADWLRNSRL